MSKKSFRYRKIFVTLIVVAAIGIAIFFIAHFSFKPKTSTCAAIYENKNQISVKNPTGKFAIYMPSSWSIYQNDEVSTEFELFSDPQRETYPGLGSISIQSDKTKSTAQKGWETFQKIKAAYEANHYIANVTQSSQVVNCHPAQVITFVEKRTTVLGEKVNNSNKVLYIDYGKYGHAYVSITWSNDNPIAEKDIDTFMNSLTFDHYNQYPAPQTTRSKIIQDPTKQVQITLPNSWLQPFKGLGMMVFNYNDGSTNDFFGNVIQIQIDLGEQAKEKKDLYDNSDEKYFSGWNRTTTIFNGYPTDVTTFKEKRIISKDLVIDRTHKNYYVNLGNNKYAYISTFISNKSLEYEPEMNRVLSSIQFIK